MDSEEVQNRFAEAPDLSELRHSSKRPSLVARFLTRASLIFEPFKNPNVITAILALLIVAAIAVGVWSIT